MRAAGGYYLRQISKLIHQPGLNVPRREALAPGAVAALLAHGLPGATVATPADPRRRELGADEAVRRLRGGAGLPGGDGRLDYTFDDGPVRCVVLDLARRRAGSGGVVTTGDLAFLRGALARAGRRWVLVFSHQALTSSVGAAWRCPTGSARPRRASSRARPHAGDGAPPPCRARARRSEGSNTEAPQAGRSRRGRASSSAAVPTRRRSCTCARARR